MGKFILSNLRCRANSVIEKSIEAGFQKSGEFVLDESENSLHYCAFNKLVVGGGNFLKIGEDFVSIIGSCIYHEEIGERALSAIYNDFEGELSIPDVRNNIIGNCAFIIKKGESIYVFGETYAIYSIYYTIEDGRFAISNSLLDVVKIITRGADNNNLYSQLCFGTMYCGGTIFNDTYRLTDDKYILIDCIGQVASIRSVDSKWVSEEKKDYLAIVNDVAKNLTECARIVAKCYGAPALCSTGGLDNRVNLSAFLANKIKPELYYGKGNSTITNTDNEDNEINKIYANQFGLDYHLMSWIIPNPLNRDWNDSFEKYGLDYRLYSGSKDIYATFENIKNKIIFFGYYGEMYRNLDFIENLKKETFNIDEYIDEYLFTLFDTKEVLIKDIDSFRCFVKKQLIETCKKWGINPDAITKQEEQYLSIERRSNSDSGYINWVNSHHYCLAILAQPRVMKDVLNLDAEHRKKGKFMLDVLNKIYSPTLEVPVYTHRQRKLYDKENNMLVAPKNKTMMERFLDFGRPIQNKFIRNRIGRFLVFKIYWLLLNEEKRNQIKEDQQSLKLLEGIINNNGWKRGVNYGTSKNGRILKQLEIAQYLWAYSKVTKLTACE